MAPNMKDEPQQTDFNTRATTTNFNILKALLQITIQVSSDKSRIGFHDLLKPPSKFRGKSEDSLPLVWILDDDGPADKWIRKEDNQHQIDKSEEHSISISRKISSPSNSRKNSTVSDSTSRKSSSASSNSRKSSSASSNSRKSSSASTTGSSRKNSVDLEYLSSRKNSKDMSSSKLDKLPLTKRWRRPSFKRNKSKDDCRSHSPIRTVARITDVIDQMTLQQHLALKALNLTAPASSSALRSQRHSFVQLSGHQGYLSHAGPQTIYKKVADAPNEASVYKELMNDLAIEIVPKFFGEVEIANEKFIEISDLLHGFRSPCMIDIKMGSRTFLESEADNLKPREDLYLKMMKVDDSVILNVEHENRNMTKLRYMNLRDLSSSSRSLGFRLEALKMSDSSSVTQMKKLREKEIVATLSNFVQNRESTKSQIVESLLNIREVFSKSTFFRDHEVIGSSILIVYDETHAGAWIIDFAKTKSIPEGISITHRDEWVNGNHEDGYLLGIENLIDAFEQIRTN